MAKAVPVNQLANELAKMMQSYTDSVEQAIAVEVEDTADKVLEEVKRLAPKRTGDYVKGFVKTPKRLKSGIEYAVWNRKHYRRVHLLEKGHAKRDGGRVAGKPHMQPAVDKYAPSMVNRIEQILKDGG